MSDQNAIQLADSAMLSEGLSALQQTLFMAAEASIRDAVGDGIEAYTALELRAMTMGEALRLTSGMDLSTIITRGNIIRQIETEGLTSVHPNGFANLTALASANGVSVGELSDIRALTDTIFPYITNVLERPLVEVWGEIGKSAFREMVPALRSLITGENASHTSVRNAVAGMLASAGAAVAQELEIDPSQVEEADVRRHAVEALLVQGATMTSRQMRRTVRPTRVDPIEMATLQTGDGQWYGVLKFDNQEQLDLVNRILNPHTNNMRLDGRGEGTSAMRRLFGSFFGATDE